MDCPSRPWAGTYGLAVVSGLMMAGAFEPLATAWLAPIAVGGLAYAVRGVSMLMAIALGYLFGLAFLGVLLFWLAHSISPVAWIALTLLMALWTALAAALMCVVLRLPGGPLWAATIWIGVELARQEWPFGGFPWGRLGFTVVDTVWSGLLPYVGVTGAGFLLALLGTVGARVVETRTPRVVLGWAGAIALSILAWAVPYTTASSGSAAVAVVQAGVPGHGNDVSKYHEQVTSNLVVATTSLADDVGSGAIARPDFVVWPESAVSDDPFSDVGARAAIETATAAAAEFGAPLLVGGLVDSADPDKVLNQGLVWTEDGPAAGRYTKHHPVPFGEYVPFRSLLGGMSDQLKQVPRDMLAGTGSAPWSVGDLAVAGAICFDVAFDDVVVPQVRNGAEIVVVQTSNATFIGTPQLDQQLAITRARAAESGRSTVVASLNGLSALLGPEGEVVAQAPERGTHVLVAELPLSKVITPAVRLTEPLRWTVIGVSIGSLVWAGFRRRSAPQSAPGSCPALLASLMRRRRSL